MIVLFLMHFGIWFVYMISYILFKGKMIFKEPLNNIIFKGNVAEVLIEIIEKEISLKVNLQKSELPSFRMGSNTIEYISHSLNSYNGIELFANVHEIVHAKQKQEGYWAYKVREFWSMRLKMNIAVSLTIVFFIWLYSSNLIIQKYSLIAISLILAIHYIICLFILISEIHANVNTYRLLVKYNIVNKENENLFKGMRRKESIDYLVSFPVLLLIG